MVRIAIVVSHPIQYFAPWYRATAALTGVTVKVFYCSRMGAETYFDQGFGMEVKWDIGLLDGYDREFLESPRPIRDLTFWHADNPTVGRALQDFNPDVVLVHGYAQRTIWRAVGWCRQNSVPAMVYSDSNGTRRIPFWKGAVKSVILSCFYQRLDGALSSGDNNRVYHRKYGMPQDRIFSGVMPIDSSRLGLSIDDERIARCEIRKRHGIPENAFLIVFAGKLIATKCPLHLVMAVERCIKQGANVWAILVGEGAERASLEEYIHKHDVRQAVLAGFVNQASINKYYAAADVLALMSLSEPKGMVVPEAGLLGCPAILSDRVGCIGPNDSARPGENALVYPWGDCDRLAECILQLYQDRSRFLSMSQAARVIAKSQDVEMAAVRLAAAADRLRQMGCRA